MKKSIAAVAFGLCLSLACAACGGTTGGTSVKQDDVKKNFPNYTDPADATYQFGFEEMTTPFYTGNVIYNETTLLIDNEEGSLSGSLQFTPVKILSIRDYTLKNEFNVSDFTVEGKKISVSSDKGVPGLTEANLAGVRMPEGFKKVDQIGNVLTDCMQMGSAVYTESPFYYGKQVYVSYVYDVSEVDLSLYASYATSGLTKTKNKLLLGDDLKIAATGDSVMEGCSSSKKFNPEPFMDCFMDLTQQALQKKYTGKITLSNRAVGGKTSGWGAEDVQTSQLAQDKPDLMYIHFGINDLGERRSADSYKQNIKKIVTDVQGANPECEFVLIKAFMANPELYLDTGFEEYWKALDEIAAELDNVYVLDLYSQSKKLLEGKKYYDVTGNGINHVNDFSSRLYAMNMIAQLVKY